MPDLECPKCAMAMEEKAHPDVTIDICSTCGGIFIDKNELNALATGMAGDIEYGSIDNAGHADKYGVRSCPKCSDRKMKKINLLRFSDVILDYCPDCNGLFLDKGEMEQVNKELKHISGTPDGEEHREYRDDHLIRIDRISGVGMIPLLEITNKAVSVTSLQVTVYFCEPLGVGFRLFGEEWTAKLARVFGLYGEQDVTTGNDTFDSTFIIQGNDRLAEKIMSNTAQNAILNFVSGKPSIVNEEGRLDIYDDRAVYTEGPYMGQISDNIMEKCDVIVEGMLAIAVAVESSRAAIS